MEAKLLRESYVKQRSKELKVPYDQFLAAVAIEEILQKIEESEYREAIWLKNTSQFEIAAYQKKVNRNLEFRIFEGKKLHYKKNEISRVFSEQFRNIKTDAVHWNYNISETKEGIICSLVATILAVRIPIKIKFRPVEKKKIQPSIQELNLIRSEEEKIELRCYPVEELLIESFLEIVEKLELINDLSCYCDIYEILKRYPFSGRTIWEKLLLACEEHKIKVEKGRLQILLSYRTSSYMKKKWKTYLRHEKRTEPDWDEMMSYLENFFANIWNGMCDNLVYLGDWIPELGRFID